MTNADLDDIREAFHKIDVDESGTITKEELYNRFLGEDSKFNVSKNDFDVLFDIIDKDVLDTASMLNQEKRQLGPVGKHRRMMDCEIKFLLNYASR